MMLSLLMVLSSTQDTDEDASNEQICAQSNDVCQAQRENMLFNENGACLHKSINLISGMRMLNENYQQR